MPGRTNHPAASERPSTRRARSGSTLATGLGILAAAVLGFGCEISPVVTAQEPPSGRFPDCERAAQSYCEHVVEAKAKDMESCVADHLYQCVSGSRR